MATYPDRSDATQYAPAPRVIVDRPSSADCGAWYEFFPRSAEGHGDRGSTFRDCLPRIDDAKAMGFDVIYFPPIHPIGHTNRKGRNNSVTCEPGDPGVPYAIGSEAGRAQGGRAVARHARGFRLARRGNPQPRDGDRARFRDQLFARSSLCARASGVVLQTAGRHDQIRRESAEKIRGHLSAEFSLRRTGGSFGQEMTSIILFWAERGVRIFRVDNPHTKPVAFWEYLIANVRAKFPDAIFLSEAFTRPKMMKALAKAGFTQSYTYFTWRNSKQELTEYFTELTQTEMREYFRGNLLPNTPDILPLHLAGRRPAGVHDSRRARGHAFERLRHLQRIRALRKRGAARTRGISRFRKISVQGAGLERAREHQGLDHATERNPPRRIARCISTITSVSTTPRTKRFFSTEK